MVGGLKKTFLFKFIMRNHNRVEVLKRHVLQNHQYKSEQGVGSKRDILVGKSQTKEKEKLIRVCSHCCSWKLMCMVYRWNHWELKRGMLRWPCMTSLNVVQ
jgi:hypothetical protein